MNTPENTTEYSKFSDLCLFVQPIYNFKGQQQLFGYEVLIRNKKSHHFPVNWYNKIILSKDLHSDYIDWFYLEIEKILKATKEIISINLHPQQLYYEETFSTLNRLKVYNKRILIEITEHDTVPPLNMSNSLFIKNAIERIKTFQFSIALDDVGTGIYNTQDVLSLLKRVNIIKFSTLFFPSSNINVLSELIYWKRIADRYTLKLIIEGVESKDLHKILLKNNLFLQQGFYFSKPFPSVELERIGHQFK